MKRVLAILCSLMLISSFAWAEDYSAMTTEELHTAIDLMRNELLKRDLVIGEKLLLFEEGGVSLYLTGKYEVSKNGILDLETLLINDNNEKVEVFADDNTASINGWDVACHPSIDANPGKKSKGRFQIWLVGAEISTYEEIEELELRLHYRIGKECTRFEPITLQFPMR